MFFFFLHMCIFLLSSVCFSASVYVGLIVSIFSFFFFPYPFSFLVFFSKTSKQWYVCVCVCMSVWLSFSRFLHALVCMMMSSCSIINISYEHTDDDKQTKKKKRKMCELCNYDSSSFIKIELKSCRSIFRNNGFLEQILLLYSCGEWISNGK